MNENDNVENQVEETPAVEEGEPTTTEPTPRPDYIPEKFWNAEAGNVNMEEFGRSYSNLEKYVGGKKDEMREVIINELSEEADSERPESYELPKLPEGVTEEMLQDNGMAKWWKEHCDENAYSQEIYEEGINQYVDSYISQAPNLEKEIEKLGENANARLDAVNSWATTFFPPEEYEAIAGTLGATAEGIEALERMMQTTKQTITSANQVAQPERPLTLDDVRNMMKDKRYYDPKERDASFVRKVDDAFSRLYR